MKLIRLAVERPVTTAMVYAAIVLIGIISVISLPKELFPTVTFPELHIVTRYGAAAPEEIENIITKLVEEQAGTVPNLRRVRSISREGVSIVILEFNWGTDIGLAHLSVREKIDLIKDRLPSEAEEPIVERYNPFAQPMMILSASGDLSLNELTRIANDVVKKRLQKVDGVASAIVNGGQEREILVEVDSGKMASSNVSISGIVDALKNSNVNYPAGTTQGRFYEYLVRTIGEFQKVEEIGKTIVAVDTPRESPEFMFKAQSQRKGAESFQPRAQRMLALNNIAEVKDTFAELESYSRRNGHTDISIAVHKQFDANTIKAAARTRRALEELKYSLPKGMKLDIVYDESNFIKGSLQDILMDGFLGGFFAFLVLRFFLNSTQDALIVTLSLPISMLIFFIFLFAMGRTVNVIALMGLSLAIGSITDNAIAVLDNIVKFRKKLGNAKEAAIEGPSEIIIGQVVSMFTNIVVFFPLLFARGLAQQLFKDLFYAVVITNIAALIVAITLVPRITAYPLPFLKQKIKPEEEDQLIGAQEDILIGAEIPGPETTVKKNFILKYWHWFNEGLTESRAKKLYAFYQEKLKWSIAHRKVVFQAVAGLMLFSIGIFYFKQKIFMPPVDQGQFFVKISMPVGTKLDITNQVMSKIESILSKMEEVKDQLVRVGSDAEEKSLEAMGPNQAECLITVDKERASGPTEEVILKLKDKMKNMELEGAKVEYLLQDSSMKSMTGTSAPIMVMIKGSNLNRLKELSDEIQLLLKKIPGIEGVKTTLALPSFENRVSIDKDRSSGFNLSVSEIAKATMIGIRGFDATVYKEEGKEIPIRVRLRQEDRNNPVAIQRIGLRTQSGFIVALGDVASISSGYGPSEIQRTEQQRSAVVSAQVFGRSLGDVIEEVDKKLLSYKSLREYSVDLGGTKQEMKESFGGLILALILAITLIYMIMAAGFESLLHPLLIMITVPLGVIGVALTVLLTWTPLSVPIFLGIVILGGIVVNNGVVLIEHFNELRKEGMGLTDAVIQGCSHRLTPIIMTALTTILALVPMAAGLGQGIAKMLAPMALATLGGLFISTTLTLFVLPLLYLTIEERRNQKI